MECPVTVPYPEVGTPPIQDRVQLLDHHIDASVRRKRPCHFTYALANIAAGLLTWPHTQHPTRRFTEFEAQKRETLSQRRQPTLLLIHHQVKSGELTLELIPRLLRRALRLRQQHHIVRITDQPNMAESDTVAPAPLTIYLVQKDVGQRRRNHPTLGRTPVGMRHLAFLHDSCLQPSPDQA